MGTDSKPFLLIVEDDIENQKFLRIFLKKSFNVEVCDSAEECYASLNSKPFDIILMDISLRGDKDGLQLTQELRSNPLFKNIPILALTAHAFQKDKINAMNAGVDLFITKPVDAHFLKDTLLNLYREKNKVL